MRRPVELNHDLRDFTPTHIYPFCQSAKLFAMNMADIFFLITEFIHQQTFYFLFPAIVTPMIVPCVALLYNNTYIIT
jgi:hypothetical protein